MQDDGLGTARHLNGTVRIAAVDDVGRIRARAERLFSLDESQRSAVLEAIPDSVRFGRDLPFVGEEGFLGLGVDPVPVKSGKDPDLRSFRYLAP